MISINEIIRRIALNEECNYKGKVIDASGAVHGVYENNRVSLVDNLALEEKPTLYVGLGDGKKFQYCATIIKNECKRKESVDFHCHIESNSVYDVDIELVGKSNRDTNSILIRCHHTWAKIILEMDANGAYFVLDLRAYGSAKDQFKLKKEKITPHREIRRGS